MTTPSIKSISYDHPALLAAARHIKNKVPDLAKQLANTHQSKNATLLPKVIATISTLPDTKKLKLTPEQLKQFASKTWDKIFSANLLAGAIAGLFKGIASKTIRSRL